MAYAHDLHCPTDSADPQEVGWCDRCYRKFYLKDLNWQYDVSGNSLQNLGIKVCQECYDKPADILRPIIIVGPEGVVRDPRPPAYAANFAGGVAAPESIGEFLSPSDIPGDGP